MSVALSLVAAVVAGLLSARLGRRYLARRRSHALAWSGSLALFAVASAAVALGLAQGWSPAVFLVYWVAGALVTVPLLAAGQLMFMDPARTWLYWTLAALAGLGALVAVATSSLDSQALAEVGARIPTGEAVFGDSLAVALLPPFNYTAAIVVAGVAWSAIRTRRWGLLFIALGVLVAGASFAFVRAGLPAGFSTTLASGVILMYVGFRAAERPSPPARPHAPPTQEGDTGEQEGDTGEAMRRPRITVYTRQGCGLCREAERLVAEVAGDEAHVEHVDVDADPALFERYTVRVPVVAVDGEELFELEVDQAALSEAVQAAAHG